MTAKAKLTEITFNTSILVERGRLFFKISVVNDHGREKEPAYRGYRPEILEQLVIAHQIAYGWGNADEDMRLRMRVVAEDCSKKFVSLMQKEVGRDRTASADAGAGGKGLRLSNLLNVVNEERITSLKRVK